MSRENPYDDNQEIVEQLDKLGNALDNMKNYHPDDFYEHFTTSDIYFVKEAVAHLWGLYDTYVKLSDELWDMKNG